MKKVLLIAGLLAVTSSVFAQSGAPVKQSGNITSGQVPWWITSGVIGGGVTAVDSPITSFGATGPVCSNSARQASGAWNSLCFQSSTTGAATITLQNYGTATAQPLNFVLNGVTYTFPFVVGPILASLKLGPNAITLENPPILGAASLLVAASATGVNSFIDTISYGTTNLPGFVSLKARGTQAVPTAAKKDDVLGIFSGLGYGATAFGIGGAQILIGATQDYTDFNQGGRVDINVTPNSAGQVIGTIVRFDQDGTIKAGPNVATLANPITSLISPVGALFTGAMGTNINTFVDLHAYGAGNEAGYVTYKARGTQNAPTAVQSGDLLGLLQFGGFGSTAYGFGGAKLLGTASQTWTDAHQGSFLSLFSTPNNTAVEVEGFRLNHDSRIVMGPYASTLLDPLGNNSVWTAASADNGNTFVSAITYGDTVPGGGPTAGFVVLRANGTHTVPTAAKKDDLLGIFSGLGYGATAFGIGGAQIAVYATQDYTDFNQGGRIDIQVARNSAGQDVFTSARFDQNGTLTLGPNVATLADPITTLISPVSALITGAMGTGANTFVDMHSYGTGITSGYVTNVARGTQAVPTAVQSGDLIGLVQFGGYGASAYGYGGVKILGTACQNWTDAAQCAYLSFYYTPSGSAVEVEGVRLSQTGGLGVGTTSDPGVGLIYTNSASFMNRSKTSWTSGAAAQTATMTNGPTAGNPTKWIPVDDNGTTRYIPAW